MGHSRKLEVLNLLQRAGIDGLSSNAISERIGIVSSGVYLYLHELKREGKVVQKDFHSRYSMWYAAVEKKNDTKA